MSENEIVKTMPFLKYFLFLANMPSAFFKFVSTSFSTVLLDFFIQQAVKKAPHRYGNKPNMLCKKADSWLRW